MRNHTMVVLGLLLSACVRPALPGGGAGERAEKEATEKYQAAVAADPEFIDAYVALTTLYRANKPEEARATLTKAEQQAQDSPPLKNQLGEAYLLLGDLKRAESYFRQVIEQAPTFYKARLNLAATLERSERLEEADTVLRELEATNKDLPGLAERHAGLAVSRRRLDEAVKHYDKALAEPQPRAALLVAAGNVNFTLGHHEQAKKLFAQAVVDDPRSLEAHLGLARVANTTGHAEEASYEARRCLAIAESIEAHLEAGRAAEATGRGDVAKEEYTAAAKGSTEFDARMGLARLLVRSGAVRDALAELGRIIKVDHTRAEPYLLMGDCHEEMQEPARARAAYEDAVKRDLKNGEALFKLGRNLRDAGKQGVAADMLERAAKTGPVEGAWVPEALLLAGETYRSLGKREAAVRAYRRYLEVAPKTAPAREDVAKMLGDSPERR